MIITSIVFAKILLEDKKLRLSLKNIIVIILSLVLYSTIAGILDGILKTLVICLIYVIVYRSVFTITYTKSILISFEYIILSIIPDLFILLFSVYVLKFDSGVVYNTFAHTAISTLLVNILLILLTLIFKKTLRKISNIKLTNNKEIIVYLLLSLFSILVVFYTEYSNVKVSSSKELILGIIIIVSFVLILYSLVKQKMENNKLMTRYIKLLEFIKNYEKELDKQK